MSDAVAPSTSAPPPPVSGPAKPSASAAAAKASAVGPDDALDAMFDKMVESHAAETQPKSKPKAAKDDATRPASDVDAKPTEAAGDDDGADKTETPVDAAATPTPTPTPQIAPALLTVQTVQAPPIEAGAGVAPDTEATAFASAAQAATVPVEGEAKPELTAKSGEPAAAETAKAAPTAAQVAILAAAQIEAAPKPSAAAAAAPTPDAPKTAEPAQPAQPAPTTASPSVEAPPPEALEAALAGAQAPATKPVQSAKTAAAPGVKLVSAAKGPVQPQPGSATAVQDPRTATAAEASPGFEALSVDEAPASPGQAAAQPDIAPAEADLQLQTATAQATSPERVALQTNAPAASAQATAATAPMLAAAMAQKIDARTSRFELELDPAGLGKVKVSVQIDPQGRLAAQLSFDRPEAAAALRDRAGELKSALQDAGFDLGGAGLSFTSGEDGRGQAGFGQDARQASAARMFSLGADAADTADRGAARAWRSADRNLDLRI